MQRSWEKSPQNQIQMSPEEVHPLCQLRIIHRSHGMFIFAFKNLFIYLKGKLQKEKTKKDFSCPLVLFIWAQWPELLQVGVFPRLPNWVKGRSSRAFLHLLQSSYQGAGLQNGAAGTWIGARMGCWLHKRLFPITLLLWPHIFTFFRKLSNWFLKAKVHCPARQGWWVRDGSHRVLRNSWCHQVIPVRRDFFRLLKSYGFEPGGMA